MVNNVIIMLIASCIGAVGFVGCEENRNVRTESAVKAQIEECRRFLSDGNLYFTFEEKSNLRRTLASNILKIEDERLRLELVKRYVEMIRHADLRLHGNDYLEFHQRVLRFVELAGVGYNLIKKSGAKQEDLMRYLLDYMERYRAASFSLPTTGKSEEEDPATFNKRKVTAQNLLSVYQSEILAFEKMIEPKHMRLCSQELQDDFKRRSAAILDCPTREDLLKTPMFNGK